MGFSVAIPAPAPTLRIHTQEFPMVKEKNRLRESKKAPASTKKEKKAAKVAKRMR
jgi:hypothetical protein